MKPAENAVAIYPQIVAEAFGLEASNCRRFLIVTEAAVPYHTVPGLSNFSLFLTFR
jgi:hypothetical protein